MLNVQLSSLVVFPEFMLVRFVKLFCIAPFLYHLVSLFCSESVESSSLKVQVPVKVPFVLLSESLLVRLTVVAFGAVFRIVILLEFLLVP